jgi:hypothetical protein
MIAGATLNERLVVFSVKIFSMDFEVEGDTVVALTVCSLQRNKAFQSRL